MGASGDLSKLFKNENVKQPGVFGIDAPPPEATLLVREVVQNSWDAALERQEQLGDDAQHPFIVDFRFDATSGEER